MERVLAHRQPNLTVVLENVFDPHNVSAVMRTCDAVGVQEIFVLNTMQSPRKKWGHRSSSSAAKWLTVHQFADIDACFEVLRSRYQHVFTTHLATGAAPLYELDLTQSVALVFGNEQAGLSAEMLARSDGNFIIPQVGMIRSLNISVACAVSLYEAFRQKKAAGHFDKRTIPDAQYLELKKEWGIQDAACD